MFKKLFSTLALLIICLAVNAEKHMINDSISLGLKVDKVVIGYKPTFFNPSKPSKTLNTNVKKNTEEKKNIFINVMKSFAYSFVFVFLVTTFGSSVIIAVLSVVGFLTLMYMRYRPNFLKKC